MGTTSNYSWPTPEATDLVKDGWEAIKDLGDAIDTTAAASFAPGLVHINTTSFSAVASQSINDVFSDTYDNYKILINHQVTSGTNVSLDLRLRASGTDDSGNNYYRQRVVADDTVIAGNRSALSSSWNIGLTSSTGRGAICLEIFTPFNTLVTNFVGNNFDGYNNARLTIAGGRNTVTTSFDGFTIFPGSSTITGSISVFGYAKA
jgi:hypothetical protein